MKIRIILSILGIMIAAKSAHADEPLMKASVDAGSLARQAQAAGVMRRAASAADKDRPDEAPQIVHVYGELVRFHLRAGAGNSFLGDYGIERYPYRASIQEALTDSLDRVTVAAIYHPTPYALSEIIFEVARGDLDYGGILEYEATGRSFSPNVCAQLRRALLASSNAHILIKSARCRPTDQFIDTVEGIKWYRLQVEIRLVQTP